MSVTSICNDDRALWLEARLLGVGASEAAAALGFSPFESPRGVYLRKIGLMPELEETEAMRWGHLLEPVIAQEYERRSGRQVVATQIYLRSEDAPMSATLDGITDVGDPVEFKAIGPWSARELGTEGTDELPDHWILQGQQQMFISKTHAMDFAVLIAGQKLRIFHLLRDELIVQALIQGIRAFWDKVLRREAPTLDCTRDLGLMHVLYPGSAGEIDLSEDDLELVGQYEEIGTDLGELRKDRESIRAKLLDRLGDHAIGRLPDGRSIVRKVVSVGPATIERKPYKYTSFNIQKGIYE